MRLLALIFIVLFAVVSARAGDLSSPEIKEARQIYIAKCAKCHKLHDPSQYNDANWAVWMQKMNRKARLSARQAVLLSQYLDTVRAGGK